MSSEGEENQCGREMRQQGCSYLVSNKCILYGLLSYVPANLSGVLVNGSGIYKEILVGVGSKVSPTFGIFAVRELDVHIHM